MLMRGIERELPLVLRDWREVRIDANFGRRRVQETQEGSDRRTVDRGAGTAPLTKRKLWVGWQRSAVVSMRGT